MATVLDRALLESSKLKTPEGLRSHSSHSSPHPLRPQYLASFEGLSHLSLSGPGHRRMFTVTPPLAPEGLSSLALPRPPGAAVSRCAHRTECSARCPALPRGGGGARAGLEDCSGDCALPGLRAGASEGPPLSSAELSGRARNCPPAQSGARLDRDASLTRAPQPRGRSNLVRDTGLQTRQPQSWPLPPEGSPSVGLGPETRTTSGRRVGPGHRRGTGRSQGRGLRIWSGGAERKEKVKGSCGSHPQPPAGLLAATQTSCNLDWLGGNRLGN